MINTGAMSMPSIQTLVLKYHLPLKEPGSMENGLLPNWDRNILANQKSRKKGVSKEFMGQFKDAPNS